MSSELSEKKNADNNIKLTFKWLKWLIRRFTPLSWLALVQN